jgi:hypothetical protein
LENGGEKAELQRHSQLRLERKITCLCAHKEGGDESEIKKHSSNREKERELCYFFRNRRRYEIAASLINNNWPKIIKTCLFAY